MNDSAVDDLTLRVAGSIHEVDAAAWDACAARDPAAINPFVRHAFFSALEDSGSVCVATGWKPHHLLLESPEGRLIGCAPLYLKSHSYGEYVFDWGWAQAYQRAGGRYYPKLQCAVPFTPVTGPRLMVRPDLPAARRTELQRALAAGMVELARRLKVSSLHVTFPPEDEWALMTEAGLMPRIGQQYHWNNEGYGSFDDFLSALSSRKRKAIRKEREKANSAGVEIVTLTGREIAAEHWDAFYRFYVSTSDRKWGQAYLERGFFDLLSARMGDAVVLMLGRQAGRWVCGAINLRSHDTLYGRNWGAVVDVPMLHFEVCYYRAIDFAIAHKLAWVEAGAQGQHKIQRGYLPRATYSAHWIADPGLRGAVARFLAAEREAVEQDMEALAELGPFKRGEDQPC
jgi:predicted N-acyltransferase